jgi:hypothetical protein
MFENPRSLQLSSIEKLLMIAICSFFISVLFSSCSHKLSDAIDWQSNKVTADGNMQEWPDPLRFFDEKSKLNYEISNDLENLYVGMKISDEALRIKIIRGGMEFRIDTSGKNSFPIAFVFPVANDIVIAKHTGNEAQHENRHGERTGNTNFKQKMVNHAEEFQLVGFKPSFDGTKSLLTNTTGITAAISIDNMDIMYYEAIIPFKTFFKKEITPADTTRDFSFEIKVKAISAPAVHEGGGGGGRGMGGGSRGGGGGMGGDMGGGMGGGHRGGGGSHGGGQHTTSQSEPGNGGLYTSNTIVKKMRLSVK